MLPANQRLDAAHAFGPAVEYRLIDQEELVAHERIGEVHLQRHTIAESSLHRGREDHLAVASAGRCFEERDSRVTHQLVGVGTQPGGDADPDRDR